MNLACGGGSSSVFSSALNAGARQHVHFVEDVDLVARRHRRVADGVVDLAHIVDAVVRGGVHFQDVGMAAFHDRLVVHAQRRHGDGRLRHGTVRQFVIERARQNPRRRGLADAAHAGEDPGLRDAPRLEGVRDRAHHGVLADQVVEVRRPVLARQHAIAGTFGGIGVGRCWGLALAHGRIRPAPSSAARQNHSPSVWRSREAGPVDGLVIGSPKLAAGRRWEADERPDPCSLGLLPSGPDPVGEWLVHRQPPAPYIGPAEMESKPRSGARARSQGRRI